MKHIGSSFPYKKERECELLCAFKRELANSKHIVMNSILQRVVNSPCSKFWVTEERAAIVISNMLCGKAIFATDSKREMFTELLKRYKEERKKRKTEPISRIVFDIVNSPAPKFYLSISQAKIIINAARKSKRLPL